MRRRDALGAALALAALAGGCKKTAAIAAAPTASASAAPVVAARRPTIRYYLARTDQRCEVYSVDGDTFSSPLPTPCPIELQPGERFRIAGRTCIRESTDAAREVPVVCPDPLTNFEKKDQRAAAAAASASASARGGDSTAR